ncbi:MAG: hypothetical protein GX456_20230 [Verrucomicrobia bacterium]|nr:hypothetical protein [Verrucomicrobiota bacterium]
MGVGRREAFGVRQLAAALSSCPNTVSVPISAPKGFIRRLWQPRTGPMGNLRTRPQSGGKSQITSLSLYATHSQRPCRCDRVTGCQTSICRETDQTRSARTFANMNNSSI